MSGLTRQDYFQIGCEVVIELAQKGGLQDIDYQISSHIYKKIQGAIQGAIKSQRLAPPDELTADGKRKNSAWDKPEPTIPLNEIPDRPKAVDMFEHTAQILAEQALRQVMEGLFYRDKRVLEERYGLDDRPKTLDETGRMLNVTRERIRQIENQALRKLQSMPEAQMLRETSSSGRPMNLEFGRYASLYEQARRQKAGREIAERALLHRYPVSDDDATPGERRIESLAELVIEVMRRAPHESEEYAGRSLTSIQRLVFNNLPRGAVLHRSEFMDSLRLLLRKRRLVLGSREDQPVLILKRGG